MASPPQTPAQRASYRVPSARSEAALSLLLGAAFAVGLFVLMALAQMIGDVEPPTNEIDETVVVYTPPEIEEFEEEPPPLEEQKEPPPELEKEPPRLSLDQLDIALNPGTGGSLAGDFSMPSIAATSRSLGTEDFVDFSDLDQIPRPVNARLDIPPRLKRKKASGKVVILIKLDEEGRVLEASVDSSNLPAFEDFVREAVAGWRFTPPTQQGRPVRAHARLPIPINIR